MKDITMSDTVYFKEDDRTACREIMDEAKDRKLDKTWDKEVDSWNKFPNCALMKQTFYSDTAGKKFVLCDLKRSRVTLKECLCCEHSVSNDQTAKADAGKAQLSLVPQKIIYAIARIREYGNNKYPEGGKDNWKSVEKQRYVDAMLRHISAYVSDPEGVDEESGFPHLFHAVCNAAFILEMEEDKYYELLYGTRKTKPFEKGKSTE